MPGGRDRADAGAPASRPHDEHAPALDGLRGLAVLAVVLFHLDHLPGGNLGVDAFFVLSGWLITSRLLAEADRSAMRSSRPSIQLRAFWGRRVRRLLPASLMVILAVSAIWTTARIAVPSLGHDVAWALGWSSNWGTITGGGDYWARFGEPSPITHFWSLAIEEQFYLVWPVVVALLVRAGMERGRILVGAVSATLAVASVAFMAATFDASRPTATYMHSLARSHSLLIGAAAAALMVSPDRRQRGARLVRRAMPVAAAAAGSIILLSSHRSEWLFSWGFPAFALAMVVVVVAAADGAGERVLAAAPLRWVGDRSYGIYLWHWPVILFLSSARSPIDGVALDIVRVAVAVALAAASYQWLEMPIRSRRRLTAWWSPSLAVGALAASLAIVMLRPLTTEGGPVAPSTIRLPGLASATGSLGRGLTGSAAAIDALYSLPPAITDALVEVTRAPAPVRVLVAGDSTAVQLAAALIPYSTQHSDRILAGSASFPGCGLTAATDGRMHEFPKADGTVELIDLSGCTLQWESIIDRIQSDEQVDIVLIEIGAWDGVDIHLPDGAVVSVEDPVGRRLVEDAYRRFVTEVEARGARVVWVTPPDLRLGWDEIDAPVNSPRRWAIMREIIDDLPVEQIDLRSFLMARGLDGPEGRPDGVHLAPDVNEGFVTEVVSRVLVALDT